MGATDNAIVASGVPKAHLSNSEIVNSLISEMMDLFGLLFGRFHSFDGGFLFNVKTGYGFMCWTVLRKR